MRFTALSDNLLFICGIGTLLLFLIHSAVASQRGHPCIAPVFLRFHRVLAAVLLLSASAHWWPFVIFLTPAVACTAVGLAVRALPHANAGHRHAPLALVCALAAAVAGICPVWVARQTWMEAHGSDFYTPFIFPPAALALAFVFARASSGAAVSALSARDALVAPLLAPLTVTNEECCS